jgi:hypothetical protein
MLRGCRAFFDCLLEGVLQAEVWMLITTVVSVALLVFLGLQFSSCGAVFAWEQRHDSFRCFNHHSCHVTCSVY